MRRSRMEKLFGELKDVFGKVRPYCEVFSLHMNSFVSFCFMLPHVVSRLALAYTDR